MACYFVPLAAAAVTYMVRRKGTGGARGFWLNIMLLGGALFGGIDHFWNGELFLITSTWMSDVALGLTITASIFGTWGIIAYNAQLIHPFRMLVRRIGFYSG